VDWRFWRRKRSAPETTVEVDPAAEASGPAKRGPGDVAAPAAPRFDDFAFEAPRPGAAAAAEAPAADDVRDVVRRKTGRRHAADTPARTVPPGFEPVLVPSLREQALVYRLAAEQRAALAPHEALDFYRAYLELCPDDAEAWLGCGSVRLAVGALDESAQAFREARRCAPRDPVPLGALGYVAGCLGDWEAAARHFGEAVALAPHDADLHARLADAQERAGHGDAARDTRQRLESLRSV
jgi:tetratricopeptide (TPR) repeat protein